MKKLIKFISLIAIVFVIGCTNQVQTKKIGVIAPFEGSNAHIGQMILNSVKLVFTKQVCDSLGIEIIPIDTKSDPSYAVTSLRTALADTSFISFIGFYHSSTALACKNIIASSKIPTLIYSASNPTVTENTDYYFRLVPTDDNQAIILADYAKKLNAKTIAILYYADEYGKGLSEGIKARAKVNGLIILDEHSYDATLNDFRPILSVVKDKNPDVIIICGFVEKSIEIINQAAEKGITATILAGDGTFNEDQLISNTGQNSEGIYVAAPYVFNESNSRNLDFLHKYWTTYNIADKRKPASWTAFAFDGANIVLQGLKVGKSNKYELFSFYKSMNSPETSFDGITGKIYFDTQGDAKNRNFSLAQVKDQIFQSVEIK
jgi:branched-chain amino acid transport system substrate-binding protein